MIRLGVNLLDFKKNYRGGINSFSLGLLKSLEKKKNIFLNIYTNPASEIFLKKIFKKSNIISVKKSKLVLLVLQFFCIIFNKKKLFLNFENSYYVKIKKKIEGESDVFYCPLSYLKPYNLNIPTVTSIHDLQHLHYKNNFNTLQLKYRYFCYEETIKKSTIIQASSIFIKKDIIKFYPHINKKKIEVINEGISNDFKFKKINIAKKKFFFFPAQLWQHKNHMTVLKSIKVLKEKYRINSKLVMVGEKFRSSKNILNFINNNKHLNIQYLGKVNFKKLISLYENCKFLISPSLYESSSIPILEACKIGRPVICSDTDPNKELGKKLKLNYFVSDSYENLAILIKKISKNNNLLKKQVNFNRNIIKYYNWDNISKQYLKLFKKIKKRKIIIPINNYSNA
jgi:glycosyltransferase involved in cell wall biosynthesis